MANNLIYVKRTTVSGRTPNTTGSYATNSQYISTGELALNLTDNKLFSSNGVAYFEIGSNTTNQNVSNTLTVKNISANGSNGTSGQVLTTNGTGTYWSTVTSGSSSLTVRSTYGNGGTVNVTVGSVTAINFDESTGLHVTDQGSGNVFVSLGSGFKYITVAGQTTITAVGEDTLAIANGSLVTLATSNSAPKTLTIDLSANVVTNAQLSSNLSSYQTTAGLSANVATLSSNSATYLGGNTAADLRTYASNLAGNAYSNAVSYAASNSYVNTTFAPKASPTFTGTVNANDVVISGNLTITGTTVVVNAATLDVKDLNITVAKGSTAAASDGAGITVDGSNAQLYYNYPANSWFINRSLVPDSNVAYDLGTDTKRWRSLYISGSTIVLGAANLAATGTSIALPAGSTVNGVNIESFAVNTTVYSTFAQNTAIYTYVNSTFQTTAGLSSNVATLTSNNTSFVGTVSAANVVSNAQLSSNLSNYQTTAGLSSNVATLTSNNTSFVGSVSAANVVSNAQLSGNLSSYQTTAGMSSYQTTAGLSSNVATLTSNNTSFVGSVSAANVVSNAQLSANLANYVNTSGAYTFTGVHTYTANVSVNAAIIANGGVGTSGQVLTSSAGGNVYWSTVTGGSVSINVAAQYTWTNTQTFSNTITFSSNVIMNGNSVSIGKYAGQTNQALYSVAIGNYAGQTDQATTAIAIGQQAGSSGQGTDSVAIGDNAGYYQGSYSIAIGSYAAYSSASLGKQGNNSIAIGRQAGGASSQTPQSQAAIAIGWQAGYSNQGTQTIAIGYQAGYTDQPNNSIVLNASGGAVIPTTTGFFVKPLRNDATPTNIAYYNTTTNEFTYGAAPASGASVTVSDTAPSSPSSGNLWYYTGTGELLVYYNDGTSSQWVTASATYVPTTFSILTVTGPTTLSGNVTISNTVTANASTGTAGQVLTSSGAGANVYWSTPSSGVTTGKAIAMAIVFGG